MFYSISGSTSYSTCVTYTYRRKRSQSFKVFVQKCHFLYRASGNMLISFQIYFFFNFRLIFFLISVAGMSWKDAKAASIPRLRSVFQSDTWHIIMRTYRRLFFKSMFCRLGQSVKWLIFDIHSILSTSWIFNYPFSILMTCLGVMSLFYMKVWLKEYF